MNNFEFVRKGVVGNRGRIQIRVRCCNERNSIRMRGKESLLSNLRRVREVDEGG